MRRDLMGVAVAAAAIGGLVAASGLTTGCAVAAGAAVGAGAVAYSNGNLESVVEAPLDTTWAAALEAMEDLEFRIESTDKDALSGHIRAETANDESIKIDLERQSDELTELNIRVGFFGDEALSRLIYDRIMDNIPEGP